MAFCNSSSFYLMSLLLLLFFETIGEGNGHPLSYSSLGNLMDRGGWQATIHGAAKELVTKQQQQSID